jgi:hypothetical protein
MLTSRAALAHVAVENLPQQSFTLPENGLAERTTVLAINGGNEEILDLQKTLKNFTLFSKLPTEIRVKIWTLACRKGRVIRVRMRFEAPKIAIPVIAHINQESRYEVLRIYTLGFRHTRGTCGKLW